jgi:hypothetical protein
MMAKLRSAEVTGRVKVLRIGYSAEGRAIPMAAIGPDCARTRVLILCRQHGDEPVSTEAAMRVIGRAARGAVGNPAALANTQLLIIPMVNPDGAERFRRVNGNGVDLNRDWVERTQPETQAVAAVYKRLAPQVVLDEHEWTVSDSRGYDALETGQSAGRVTREIQGAAVTTGAERGVPLLANRYAPNADPTLAHHYFLSRGAAAFLLETTPKVPHNKRLLLYDRMMIRVGMAARLYAPKSSAPEALGGLTPMFPPRPLRQPMPPAPWGKLSLLALGAFALVLSVLNGRPGTIQVAQTSWHGVRRIPLAEVSDLAARFQRRHAITG